MGIHSAMAAFSAISPPTWLADELSYYNHRHTPQQARVLVLFNDDLPYAPPVQGKWQLTAMQKEVRMEATRELLQERINATPATTNLTQLEFDDCLHDIATARVANIVCFNRFAGRLNQTMYAAIGLFQRDCSGEEFTRQLIGHEVHGFNPVTGQRCALGHESGHFDDYLRRPGPHVERSARELTADRGAHHSLIHHGGHEAAAMLDLRMLGNFLNCPLPAYQNSYALTINRKSPLPIYDEALIMAEVMMRTGLAQTSLQAGCMPLSHKCLQTVANEIMQTDCQSLTPTPQNLAMLRPLLHEGAFTTPGPLLLAKRLYTAATRIAPQWL